MRYYLDTNMLVFVITENQDDISSDASAILTDCGNTFYASSVAVTELILLYKSGKITPRKKLWGKHILDTVEGVFGIKTVYFDRHHMSRYVKLELSEGHKDMNDHAIIAQAISDRIPLISSDAKFRDYVKQGLTFVYNKR
jgi:PIN domain nuclease of toxin-antitoxin system